MFFFKKAEQAKIKQKQQEQDNQKNTEQKNAKTSAPNEITVAELKQKLDSQDGFELIDVREKKETDISTIQAPNCQLVPMGEVPSVLENWGKTKVYVVYCARGGRSGSVVDYMCRQGFENVYNLVGGIHEWKAQIDPNMEVY